MKKQPLPKWLTKIPPNTSHGSTPTQQRYWRVVSDFVRIRDFYEYGTCISCGKRFSHWNESQACHFKSWGACRGYSKWYLYNIFGGCAYCNTGFNGNEVGAKFKTGIISRYTMRGWKMIEKLDSHPTEKMDDYEIVNRIVNVIKQMKNLKEQPDYYKAVYEGLSTGM